MKNTEKMSRRDILKKGALGATAVAASTMLGASSVFAQESANNSILAPLSGKTAFITGGARGIGLATAEEFAKAGANIVLFDIATKKVPHVGYALSSERDLASAKAKIESLHVKCLAIKGDVRKLDDLKSAVQKTVDTFGSLDYLIANAGVTQVGAIEDFSAEEIDVVYDINVAGIIKTTQAVAPIMKRQKSGRMVFLSSALGRMGNELFPVYASTKWAIIGFAKSAALSYGKDNITCNVVAPGLVHTPLADNPYVMGKMAPNNPTATFESISESLKPGNPLPVGHLEPEDVAKAIMLFTSEVTTKVTGEVFDISYGSLARSIA
ncbi:SDR family NAD(P)-dependent oxidoreductase [Aquimarina sp. U1-2]|uniref:SDR family NAD(P)-dependent oxidoreductase n=1 Tax=Aquimarina sp. U1-2 TaxID=2823141 RepID=UPI001AECAA8D|nr:SDR family NAD(P)-dependent oxidoreductase [Aquimarina sp. U1-2]MBP2831531.1 SDR family NAD(P)-dependent oxidoreductase [Aquimarina sp. U1-2]